ncbi:hypothetical protein [Streptomyces sp. NPDC056244]|uniref:hypothetical protein n=1 Tax=Streptomyces sp. NPDC056244 TaxID=3345762 RepID=UPI0035D6864A
MTTTARRWSVEGSVEEHREDDFGSTAGKAEECLGTVLPLTAAMVLLDSLDRAMDDLIELMAGHGGTQCSGAARRGRFSAGRSFTVSRYVRLLAGGA